MRTPDPDRGIRVATNRLSVVQETTQRLIDNLKEGQTLILTIKCDQGGVDFVLTAEKDLV